MPNRIQRRRVRGWRLPDNAVIIDRSSRWGNPFRIVDATEHGYADPQRACVEMYDEWLNGAGPDVYVVGTRRFDRLWVWDHLLDLEGRDVACTCPLPAPREPGHLPRAATPRCGRCCCGCEGGLPGSVPPVGAGGVAATTVHAGRTSHRRCSVSDSTGLGDRMKAHEHVTRAVLPRRTYTICRVDGRAFHTFLRDADKPFDQDVIAGMAAVAEALCEEMSGSVFAYTQSDECSVLLTDFTAPGTEPWFNGVVQKMTSIAASTATAAFNSAYGRNAAGKWATFDARVFTIPDPVEVANYFLWRQRDAVRNSISMAAQAHFSHKRLHKVNTDRMQELLWSEKGINWNDYPAACKRGQVTVRRMGERDVVYTDRRTQQQVTTTATRSWWETDGAPHFTANPDGWLAEVIPPLPSLKNGDH